MTGAVTADTSLPTSSTCQAKVTIVTLFGGIGRRSFAILADKGNAVTCFGSRTIADELAIVKRIFLKRRQHTGSTMQAASKEAATFIQDVTQLTGPSRRTRTMWHSSGLINGAGSIDGAIQVARLLCPGYRRCGDDENADDDENARKLHGHSVSFSSHWKFHHSSIQTRGKILGC